MTIQLEHRATGCAQLEAQASLFSFICWLFQRLGANRVPCGTVAAIAVAVTMAVVWAGTTLLRRIRRRAEKLSDTEMNPAVTTISPFTLLAETSSRGTGRTMGKMRTIGRQRLETQLCVARGKMVDLEDVVEGGTSSDRDAERGNQLVCARNVSAAPPSDLEAELRAAREQINILVARMNAIEWGVCIGHDPPPEYA